MINFRDEANKIKEDLIAIRRDIHMHPEVGFEEVRTSTLIKDFLKNEGIEYREVAGTGVCGLIKGTKEGAVKTVALRGDMDALPIQDKKVCEYSSKVPGKMHACGHDAHTTILLGVAKLLNENKHLFSGNVKLLFEPAEETTGGASVMIEEGVLENPRVDKVFGLHVTEDLECGKIKIKKGVVNAASNPYKIKVIGSGGHGASPNTTVDPIVIGANIVSTLQTIVSREISPVNPSVITVGSFHAGTAQNIIPGEAEITGIIRTMTPEDRKFVCERLCEVSEGIAKTGRGSAEVIIEESYPCLINNDECVDIVKDAAIKILGSENVVEQKAPSMGVESFAYFAMERDAAFYFLGTANQSKGTFRSAHSSLFDIDEDAIPLGVAIQCEAAFNYLTIE
ncbi:amidohydrolase [Clostridium sardiniense]|uniref:Amidohydrolase n=1 Tax=Clostridium sardiniense TaxID=29369 RepID=A0ABS7KWI4_CLOSR|nr:M20 family metallopeptidase [Clostridium sardiniense]MBY0755176.1 amidohydrolase [Clostridium sardiniense]MDQ0461123.1 amidohydrolase [Clostridium sardiniense]